MAIESYKELLVWQRAMELTVEIYRLTKMLPREELFGLADQMRRSAVSIPSNIAEGQSRMGIKEFQHFLSIAKGSRSELETHLIICNQVGYLTEAVTAKATALAEEVGKMLTSLIKSLRQTN